MILLHIIKHQIQFEKESSNICSCITKLESAWMLWKERGKNRDTELINIWLKQHLRGFCCLITFECKRWSDNISGEDEEERIRNMLFHKHLKGRIITLGVVATEEKTHPYFLIKSNCLTAENSDDKKMLFLSWL